MEIFFNSPKFMRKFDKIYEFYEKFCKYQ
jgi:hypothetical protein